MEVRGREREGVKEVHWEAKPAPPRVVISVQERSAVRSRCRSREDAPRWPEMVAQELEGVT